MELIESAARATSPAEVGRSFLAALQPYGTVGIYARTHRSAADEHHTVYSRISPPGWESLYSERRFSDANFIIRMSRRRLESFRWSEAPLRPDELAFRQALVDFGAVDGVAVPVHGPAGYLGLTSLAFRDLEALAPRERDAIATAALVLHLRMQRLSPATLPTHAPLSPRERDCLAFVAEGRPDWEIGEILSLAETTVLTHIQNARRKLGARTRAHAVALAVAGGLI
jgi:DNA-binding CsgD family transcriptional regulator